MAPFREMNEMIGRLLDERENEAAELAAAARREERLRAAVMFARHELDAVRRSALAADDHLRRAVQADDVDDPLNWIC